MISRQLGPPDYSAERGVKANCGWKSEQMEARKELWPLWRIVGFEAGSYLPKTSLQLHM